MHCLYCKKHSKNPKFCDRSCAASYNNKLHKKRKLTNKCKTCKKLIISDRTYCSKLCLPNRPKMSLEDKRKSQYQNLKSWRQRAKMKAVEVKGGCCERCGYDKSLRALHFHHRDPSQKDFSISNNGNAIAWSKIEKEIKKCILVCSNCHCEIHEEMETR